MTLFCRDCVVAWRVETRLVESVVPESVEVDEGWIVVRRLALLKLAFRDRDDFNDVGSPDGIFDGCWEL